MKLARVGVIAAAILAVATVAWAQKPDFSGTWTLDPASAPAAGGGGGRGGGGGALGNGPATVKQTADALTIERTMGDAKVTLTYKLDGTESRNMMMGRGGQPADSVSTAKWDGPKLTIVTKQEMDGQVDGVHPGLDRRGQHADGGNHQRARHAEAGLQEVVTLELLTSPYQRRLALRRHASSRRALFDRVDSA